MLKFVILVSFILYSSSAWSNDCEINQFCELEGTLVVYKTPPEFTAYIELADSSCIPLALSLEQYERYSYLNDQPVAITGLTFLHSSGYDVISYKYEGRWVGNFCSASYGLYIANRGIKAR